MAKKKAAAAAPQKTQAQRLLEVARKAKVDGQAFSRAMGNDTLTKQARKPTKVG
jgi:hypothetical protein